jgi:hypothetical protein
MNSKQCNVFTYLRKWCVDKVRGNQADTFKCDKCSMLAKSTKGIVNFQMQNEAMQKLFIGEQLIKSTFGDATATEVEIKIMDSESTKVTTKVDSSFIEKLEIIE